MSGHVVGDGGGQGRAYVHGMLLRHSSPRGLVNLTTHWIRNTITPALTVLDEIDDSAAKAFVVEALARLRRLAEVYADFGRGADDEFTDGGGI